MRISDWSSDVCSSDLFWLMFAGMHVTFLPMHLTGFMSMPRRVYTYLPGMDLEITNLISTAGSYMIGAGVLLFLMDLALNFRFTVDNDAGNVYGDRKSTRLNSSH